MPNSPFNSAGTRRDFFKTSAALAAATTAGTTATAAAPTKKSASDWVVLGKSGVKVTRLALGTGTHGGREQRELGQQQFTRLVRHAYDNGVRFFETAESYPGMPEMLGIALQGLPRDSYRLMHKYTTPAHGDPPAAKIDMFRQQLRTDYIDILLLHCLRPPTWEADYAPLKDGLSEAKGKKVILSHGASVHGLPALRTLPGNAWLDLAMIRMNHNGTRMDTPSEKDLNEPGLVDEVVQHTKKVHAQGMGVISMKLCGEGRFTTFEDRDKAMRFAMNLGVVDAVTIGFTAPWQIDEAIERIARVTSS